MRPRALLCVGAFAASFVALRPARADERCECPPLTFSLPPPGAVGVPVNARIFVSEEVDRDAALALYLGDAAVPLRRENSDRPATQYWLVPEAPLEALRTYDVQSAYGGYSFTTSDVSDLSPPAFSDLRVGGTEAIGDACYSYRAASIDLAGLTDDITPAQQLLVRVAVRGEENATFYVTAERASFGYDGDYGCLQNYVSAPLGITQTAEVTAIDWAGNASEASRDSFEYEQGGQLCSCNAAGAPSAPAGFGALWLLALLRSARKLAAKAKRRRTLVLRRSHFSAL